MAGRARRCAYAFYATDDTYAVSALVAIWQLKRLGAADDIDVVLVHLNVGDAFLEKFRMLGVVLVRCDALPCVPDEFYRHCLVKLTVFTLTQYDRILFMDADSLPLATMVELFDLDHDNDLAAPKCWWYDDGVTTCLMLCTPSVDLYSRVSKHFSHAAEGGLFDMDIVNKEFNAERGGVTVLDPAYGCLNTVWETAGADTCFGDQSQCIERMKYIHFSALGKPWMIKPGASKRARPGAHPFFHELYGLWWARLCEAANALDLPALPR